jgi:hypothetical protein
LEEVGNDMKVTSDMETTIESEKHWKKKVEEFTIELEIMKKKVVDVRA